MGPSCAPALGTLALLPGDSPCLSSDMQPSACFISLHTTAAVACLRLLLPAPADHTHVDLCGCLGLFLGPSGPPNLHQPVSDSHSAWQARAGMPRRLKSAAHRCHCRPGRAGGTEMRGTQRAERQARCPWIPTARPADPRVDTHTMQAAHPSQAARAAHLRAAILCKGGGEEVGECDDARPTQRPTAVPHRRWVRVQPRRLRCYVGTARSTAGAGMLRRLASRLAGAHGSACLAACLPSARLPEGVQEALPGMVAPQPLHLHCQRSPHAGSHSSTATGDAGIG
jgi:hypothetical protein